AFCAVTMASTPGAARAAGGADARSSFLAAASGDARARRAVRRAGEALGSAVADLVSILNPAVVILGGGVMDGGARRLLPAVRDAVRRYA
ncbi:MAG: ROK family protein, partial [bacterium]